jgi:hypothetical protein
MYGLIGRSVVTEEKPQNPTIPVQHVENLFAAEFFASEASSFSVHSGVVTITFVSHRYDHSVSPPARRNVVVARVALPPSGAKSLAVGLYNFLSNNGMDPVPRPKEPTEVQ